MYYLSAPIRQWVFTLPYPLRYRSAYDAKLTSEVLRAFLRALFAELRRRIRREFGARTDECGAVTFVQRFGSAMNLNLHFHTLAFDVHLDLARRGPRGLDLTEFQLSDLHSKTPPILPIRSPASIAKLISHSHDLPNGLDA